MNESKNRWAVVLVIALAVAGFAFAGVVGVSPSVGANAPTSSATIAAPTAVLGGPLTPVTHSDSGLSPTMPTQIGQYTIVPDPSALTGSSAMTVTVALKPTADLTAYANAVANPNSPDYQHFFTVSGVAQQFGQPSATYAGVVSYFEGFGLHATLSGTSLGIELSGSPAQIGAAFHSNVQAFQMQYASKGLWNPLFGNASGTANTTESRVFYATTGTASLPQGVESLVAGVSGLTGAMATPTVQLPLGLSPATAPTNSSVTDPPLTSIQGIAAANYTWSNVSHTTWCSHFGLCKGYQFLFPSTMHVLTGAQNLWNGNSTIDFQPDTGQGVTVAVVEVGCAIPSDLASFSQQVWGNPNQLPNRVTQIAINDPTAIVPNTNLSNCVLNGFYYGWTIETELDIEYIAAMAPSAHIDVVGMPSAFFSSIDNAYLDIAQYLSTGSSCALSGSPATIVAGPSQGACSVTITSNSYGTGEADTAYVGSPMYLTVEDQNLHILNLVGVTNFFASGDGPGAAFGSATGAGIPAVAEGSTSVGGGQLTAAGPGGQEFPNTGVWTCMGHSSSNNYCFGLPAQVVPAVSIGSFTYWAYDFGLPGTNSGVIGGGYGQSISEQQPWWQNALDTYSSGQKMDPVISGSAAFNMTVWANGQWDLFFGGTSFATPIAAGEWALIEEQTLTAFNTAKMGDVNPLLYDAHNAWQAGVPAASADAFYPMSNIGTGYDWAPRNSFTLYFYNLSINSVSGGVSSPPIPQWFPSLGNPAGSGWNYLQGLGMPLATTLDNEVIGQVPSVQHALDNEPFAVLEVGGSGLVPFTTLVGGTTYTFQVVLANGPPGGYYTVQAYSGGTGVNTYGGGTVTTISTGSNGQFAYTPTYAAPPLEPTNATEYGYFLVTSVGSGPSQDWSFLPFAVGQPAASGGLTLCVTDAYGVCQGAIAETTMFTTVPFTGFYQYGAGSFATLNGQPVANAMVWQVAVQSTYGLLDPTLAPGYYAPGATIGHFLTDTRGSAEFWVDAFLAETNGTLYPQVYLLTATYDGLVSNTVIVFVEPQDGSMHPVLSLNAPETNVVGTVSFSDLKYVDFLNVSVGSAPGQYVNYTCGLPGAFLGGAPTFYGFSQPPNTVPFPQCLPYYDANPITSYEYPANVWNLGVWESSISDGILPVNITAPASGPVVVSIIAGGTNDVSFEICLGSPCIGAPSVQYPMYWQDPLVFLPTHLSASATGTVAGNDTLAWAGTAYPGAAGKLELVTGGDATVLATGVSGTYTLNTASLLDGYYTVQFVETASGATTSQQSVSFYADNQVASANALIAQLQSELAADAATIATLNTQVASLQSSLAADSASIASLQSEVASLQGQVSTLQGQLTSAQAQVSALTSLIATLAADNAVNASEVATLQAQLSIAQGTLSTDAAQITSLQGEVQTLQNELNAKKSYIGPAWYDTFPGGGLAVLGLFAALGAGVAGTGAYLGGRRAGRKSQIPAAPEGNPTVVPPAKSVAPAATGSARPDDEEILRRARMAKLSLLEPGRFTASHRLGEATERIAELAGHPQERTGSDPMYR